MPLGTKEHQAAVAMALIKLGMGITGRGQTEAILKEVWVKPENSGFHPGDEVRAIAVGWSVFTRKEGEAKGRLRQAPPGRILPP